MILYRLPLLILVMGLLYIFIIPDEPLILKLFFKLIPMVMIIYYAIIQLPKRKSHTHLLIIIGLFFSMIGDATLHWFVIGLTAFLIGHIFYLAAFFTRWNFSWIRFILIVPIIGYGIFMAGKFMDALNQNGNEALIIPVLAYITAISLMALSAIMTGNKWAITGSVLFVISDSVLAWNMFISPVNYSGVLVMTTYYGAQFLIAQSLASIVRGSNRIIW